MKKTLSTLLIAAQIVAFVPSEAFAQHRHHRRGGGSDIVGSIITGIIAGVTLFSLDRLSPRDQTVYNGVFLDCGQVGRCADSRVNLDGNNYQVRYLPRRMVFRNGHDRCFEQTAVFVDRWNRQQSQTQIVCYPRQGQAYRFNGRPPIAVNPPGPSGPWQRQQPPRTIVVPSNPTPGPIVGGQGRPVVVVPGQPGGTVVAQPPRRAGPPPRAIDPRTGAPISR
ncbi:MAG: hypothetical protein AB7F86_19755 [Bdellovibrionales bacterium]